MPTQETVVDRETGDIKTVYKGFCNGCNRETETLHKCPKCGKYVARPVGSARQLSRELSRGRREIRVKYKPELERLNEALAVATSAANLLETKAIQAKIDAITKTMKAEIAVFLNPPNYVPGNVVRIKTLK